MTPRYVPAAISLALLTLPATAWAGGFEIGTNTALANARGGTGVVSKSDPSATTFNPGRLPFARGLQVLLGSNAVDLEARFQRDPLVRPNDVQTFDEVHNVSPPFPVPYLAASWDLGTDNLAVGISASGPHAYGSRCFSEIVDGECQVDFTNAARHMVVDTQLFEVYMLASVAYAFEFDGGKLGIGLSGGPAYQDNNLTLVIDQVGASVGPPYTENPDFQAVFGGAKLRDWRAAFVGGLAWEGNNGLRLGIAYQPGISWEANGHVELTLPGSVRDLITLTDDGLVLRDKQAHRLTAGAGYAGGTHPGVEGAPLYDVEMNVVWEDWSRLDAFEIEPQGSLDFSGIQELPLNPVVQPKKYQDTYALRLGGTYGVAKWLSLHAGAFLETAAQRMALTNADFISWERYSGSLGATLHATRFVDVTLSYAYVGSPPRNVEHGDVYSQIPLSRCVYPGYDQEACAKPGTPPGNPQNEGEWHSHFNIAGLNVTGKF